MNDPPMVKYTSTDQMLAAKKSEIHTSENAKET